MHALELITHLDLSAASGVVEHRGRLFIVADDGLALLRVGLDGRGGERVALRAGAGGDVLAKQDKPDFEALVVVGEHVLALGSGSGPARRGGALVNAEGGAPRAIDLSPLYLALAAHVTELNIEGGVVRGEHLLLAQRGNGARRENALVRLRRDVFEHELATGTLTGRALDGVVPVSLGRLGGTPLSLTDLGLGPRGELLFTAAAEDTANPWEDGAVSGSVIGVLVDGRVADEPLVTVEGVKLEGVCCVTVDGAPELRLVADPDDAAARAPLYRLPWR